MAGTEGLRHATRNWYDDLAEEWPSSLPEAVYSEIVERLNVPARSGVLDAGCADGVRSLGLAAPGYHVAGVDLSLQMITRAREHAVQMGLPDTVTR